MHIFRYESLQKSKVETKLFLHSMAKKYN